MRQILLVLFLLMLPLCACSESLPECQTPGEVLEWLHFPTETEEGVLPREVQAGMVRYIGQKPGEDPLFCEEYWLGGEKGSELDLTLQRNAAGKEYTFYCGTMCTRATYSMALSFLGIDMTPGAMSRLMNARNLDEPYDRISATLDVERVKHKSYIFKKMYSNYTADPQHYSPIYVYLEKPNGVRHAVLVVGREEGGRYLVVDSAVRFLEGEPVYVYSMSFNPAIRHVVNCTFRREFQNSTLLAFYQWKLKDE